MGGRNTTRSNERGFVPLLVLVACLIVGGYVVWARPGAPDAPYVWLGLLALPLAGLGYVAWGCWRRTADDGVRAAVSWVFAPVGAYRSRSPSSESITLEEPPVPEPLQDEVRRDRAEGRCEFCQEEGEELAVHHIVPRSKGGPNTLKNLIALCPTCQTKADRGVYSRSELRDRVRETEAQREDRWR